MSLDFLSRETLNFSTSDDLSKWEIQDRTCRIKVQEGDFSVNVSGFSKEMSVSNEISLLYEHFYKRLDTNSQK